MEIITHRHLRSLQKSKGFFYAHANKGGKLLARLLRGTLPRTQVRKLRLSTARTSPFPNDIADEFQSFYHSLYNLHEPNYLDTNRSVLIDNYLQTFAMKTASPAAAEALDGRITEEEMSAALKGTKVGKAPGPDGFFSWLL
ncbi:Hypothetical predicted protein [Pelobates cultripes]|uniref:Uncharacterized protein n=1 Tax=Pelobates cultripes TaxID=61616 RepID=A0AAD1W727_PELCU|nr:Hypothetical predicted protein [Pelobates cultripes]